MSCILSVRDFCSWSHSVVRIINLQKNYLVQQIAIIVELFYCERSL